MESGNQTSTLAKFAGFHIGERTATGVEIQLMIVIPLKVVAFEKGDESDEENVTSSKEVSRGEGGDRGLEDAVT